MSRFNNVLEAVGATPLIRLNHIGNEFGSEIFVKFEAVNPGGSIKDRIGEDYFPVTYDKEIVDQFFPFPTANRSAPRAAWSARRVFSPAAPPEPRSRNGRCADSAEERTKRGIHDNLIRLSVGLENGDDLTEDLRTALQR